MNLVERISEIWQKFISVPEVTIAMSVSILAFAVLYYYMIKFLADNESGSLTALFVVIMLVGAGVLSFIKDINSAVYLLIPAMFIIAIMVLYSTELKRLIWTRRSSKMVDVRNAGTSYDEEKIQKCITEIIKALQNMSKNDVGAILVLSNGNVPNQILDSGVKHHYGSGILNTE